MSISSVMLRVRERASKQASKLYIVLVEIIIFKTIILILSLKLFCFIEQANIVILCFSHLAVKLRAVIPFASILFELCKYSQEKKEQKHAPHVKFEQHAPKFKTKKKSFRFARSNNHTACA